MKKVKFKGIYIIVAILILSTAFYIVAIAKPKKELPKVVEKKEVVMHSSEVSEEERLYITLRNNLIKEHGREKAYEMIKEDSKEILDILDIREFNKTLEVPKGIMEISVYKNYTKNIMDIVYEINYKDKQSAGIGLQGDLIKATFTNHDVVEVSTTYSGNISQFNSTLDGASGVIDSGTTKAYIIFTLKPVIRNVQISDCKGGLIMEYDERIKDIKGNNKENFKSYYLECSGW